MRSILDPQIDVTVIVSPGSAIRTDDKNGGTLLSATVAARGLRGLEGGEEPVRQFGTLHFLGAFVGFGHGGCDGFTREQKRSSRKTLNSALATCKSLGYY